MKTEHSNYWNRLRGLGHLAMIGGMILTAGLAAGAEDLSVWQKRMPIAFSGYTPPGGGETLTNFPVLVILSNTTTGVGFNYNDFQSSPYGDLRFAAADKTTALDFEVESWDTNGLSHVWVRVPELTADTTIYALWGKSGVDAPPCTTNGDVWVNGFNGVWHLGLASATQLDSTTNGNHATPSGGVVTGVVGKVAGAVRLNGSNGYLSVPHNASIAMTDNFTAEVWFRRDAYGVFDGFLGKMSGTYTKGWSLVYNNNSPQNFAAYIPGAYRPCDAKGVQNDFAWHHFVLRIRGGFVNLFLDGVQQKENTAATIIDTGKAMLFGKFDFDVNDHYLNGVLDEIRMSSVPRSSNWVWATYMNTASNDVIAIYGTPESQDLPGVGGSGSATNVTTSGAWLNGTLSSTGTSATAVFAYWGTTDGGTNASAWANTNTWAAPQTPGAFTTQATALSTDSTYYSRVAASNEAGWAWAPEASVFITGDVWIEKTTDASEIGPTPGTFTVHRAAAATNEALTVTCTVAGTATPGADYTTLSGTVTIPKGEQSVTIEVMPVFDYFEEGAETVVVTLAPGPYIIGTASNATVKIADYGAQANENLFLWQKRMPLAFRGYAPSGGDEILTNFPVLVVLSNTTIGAGFNHNDFLSPPYDDLRFAADDKQTQLDFEVESWATNGLSYVWVRIPELTADTTIYVLWGKSDIGAPPPCTANGAVWTNGYVGVWHLAAMNNVRDSTSNRYDGASTTTTNATGQVDGAQGFNGSSTHVNCGNVNPVNGTKQLTVAGWARAGAPLSSSRHFHRKESVYAFGAGWSGGTHKARLWINNGGWRQGPDSITSIDDGNWYHVVGVWDAGLINRIYVNGKQEGASAMSGGQALSSNANPVSLGSHSGTGEFWNGQLDEVRISIIARSSNWIWADYMTMASNDVFAAYEDPESQDLPSVSSGGWVTNVTISDAWLSGLLMSTGFSGTAVFVYWGLTDGGTNASSWANTNTWVAPQEPSTFTVQATGLSADSTYYTRFAASNEAGWAWASEPSVFITGDVWIEMTANALEDGPTPGTFTVHRAVAATNEALIVTYTVSGTATPDVDYTALSGTVTIPKGEANATIEVMPIFDHFVEGTETVEVTLVLGPYMIGSLSNATVNIEDYGLVTRTWNGDGADTLASNPANWVEGEAPIAGDAITLNAMNSKNMTWDLNLPVQSWTQDGYTGTVTIATVYPGQGPFTNLMILGDCVISNGVWTQLPNTTVEAFRLRVSVGGDLIVGPEMALDVTGTGFKSSGPGGGASGGYGGRARIPWNIAQAGYCYGSITAPVNIGSGGTPGGGAIHLTVSGTLQHHGAIRANGTPAIHYNGSGGGIYLVSGAMEGDGSIEANGGYCTSPNGGAGGRVALVVTNMGADFSLYTGSVLAKQGGTQAGAGTVYRETWADGPGRGAVLINGSGGSGLHFTEINPNVTETVLATVLIVSNGHMTVVEDYTLEMSGLWSNTALFTAQAGSQVVFSDRYATTSTIQGATSFLRLVATNEGTTLCFAPGSTTAIAADGLLNFRGSDSKTNLFLRSQVEGSSWRLNVNGAASQTVWYVDVQDCDASSGNPITAFFSRDRGGNTNWVFSNAQPGITNVWTGADNALWTVGANWMSDRVPVDEDSILIPMGLDTYPTIDEQGRTVAGLVIESGASLNLGGFDLTVNSDARIAGTLACAASETVTFRGAVDFSDGAFNAASSTVVLAGTSPQTVSPVDLMFHKVAVKNTQTVTFGEGFSAYELRCEPPDGEARSVVFAAGKTVTLRLLALLSAPGTTNIMLRSSMSGQPWGLVVTNDSSVRGVHVKDSDASAGRVVYASGSYNAGGNSYWDFGQNWAEWTGSTGNGTFTDAANWLPAAVPDESSWVRVANDRLMTISATATVHRLVVGGGASVASVIANAAVTVLDSATVMANGLLTLNRPTEVVGNLSILSGGTLTHSGNADTEINKLDIRVHGAMAVESDAIVTVTAKGYASGKGPGAAGGVVGGSYGGRAGGQVVSASCYGSIVAPTNLGSGGGYAGGGGAVRCAVSGNLRHDGVIRADSGSSGYPTGSGGSIWFTAGTMAGAGAMSATAETAGGGGRIALVVTNTGANFDGLIGPISVRGGGGGYGIGGAGTIYKQRADDLPGRGTVRVDNTGRAGYTDVPSATHYVPGEVDRATFYVANLARLRLMTNFTVGDIWLDTANAWLDLGSNTLFVNAREHPLGLVTNVLNFGEIVWKGLPPGVLIIVK